MNYRMAMGHIILQLLCECHWQFEIALANNGKIYIRPVNRMTSFDLSSRFTTSREHNWRLRFVDEMRKKMAFHWWTKYDFARLSWRSCIAHRICDAHNNADSFHIMPLLSGECPFFPLCAHLQCTVHTIKDLGEINILDDSQSRRPQSTNIGQYDWISYYALRIINVKLIKNNGPSLYFNSLRTEAEQTHIEMHTKNVSVTMVRYSIDEFWFFLSLCSLSPVKDHPFSIIVCTLGIPVTIVCVCVPPLYYFRKQPVCPTNCTAQFPSTT